MKIKSRSRSRGRSISAVGRRGVRWQAPICSICTFSRRGEKVQNVQIKACRRRSKRTSRSRGSSRSRKGKCWDQEHFTP